MTVANSKTAINGEATMGAKKQNRQSSIKAHNPERNTEKASERMVVVHIINDDDTEAREKGFPLSDIRSNKPFVVHSKNERQALFCQKTINTTMGKHRLEFVAPNEISLSLSIAAKSKGSAENTKKELLTRLDSQNGIIFNEDAGLVYDYLEEIQKAIVFSYKAIESFCNEAIPEDYIYIRNNQKGWEERLGKTHIERWTSTSEKVDRILPDILSLPNPSSEAFWPNFRELERLRNEIIHSKSSVSSSIFAELFADEIHSYIDSSFLMLDYFIKHNDSHPRFPFGFGVPKIQVMGVLRLDEIMRKISH